jgi:hypothetical protein
MSAKSQRRAERGELVTSTLFGVALLALLPAMRGCGGDKPTAPKANRPPVIRSQPDTTAAIGDTLRLRAVAIDADQDALRYSAVIVISSEEFHSGYLPAGGIEESTGVFWFRPGHLDLPSRRVRLIVDDRRGGRDTTAFVVTVVNARGVPGAFVRGRAPGHSGREAH